MSSPQANQPPWIRSEIQAKVEWRDQDVVISVPPKSGTTWMMNIVYQLLNGGVSDFESIYSEVPWIEFLSHPEQSEQEMLDRISAMPTSLPRAFKTHSAPPEVPFLKAGTDKHVRYIVVCRNPEEALVSFQPFMDKHTDAWYELWGMPKEAMSRNEFSDFYFQVVNEMGMQGAFFGFLAAWWPLRFEPNVLFLHFADMKRDHDGSLQKIADFLSISPSDSEWEAIRDYTGFSWMKKHDDKFESLNESDVPILERGAMIRKGQVGSAKADGMNDEISAHLLSVGQQICPVPEALNWLYNGGELS